MDSNELKQFMKAQIKEIMKAKNKIQKMLGHDPGDKFIIEWIQCNSQNFHEKCNKKKGKKHD